MLSQNLDDEEQKSKTRLPVARRFQKSTNVDVSSGRFGCSADCVRNAGLRIFQPEGCQPNGKYYCPNLKPFRKLFVIRESSHVEVIRERFVAFIIRIAPRILALKSVLQSQLLKGRNKRTLVQRDSKMVNLSPVVGQKGHTSRKKLIPPLPHGSTVSWTYRMSGA